MFRIRAQIPLRSVTREHLEYPTENVTLTYLLAINKGKRWGLDATNWAAHITSDYFADKALEVMLFDVPDIPSMGYGRATTTDTYLMLVNSSQATSDFEAHKQIGDTGARIGYEAVDVPADRNYLVKMSWAGSTGKFFREDMITPKFTVTDTSIASGGWGVGSGWAKGGAFADGILRPPASPGIPALAIIEVEVESTGTFYAPMMRKDLVEVEKITEIPTFLKREKKKYDILKGRGFTDEEIELLLGYMPQRYIDIGAVTYGAFEFSYEASNIIIVQGDNPYKAGAVERQAELARARNLKALSPPATHQEALDVYKELKKEFKHWLAGKDNFLYHVTGLEVFDLFQNVDFYYGELIEHKTHYSQLKEVPTWEIERRLSQLERELEKITVLAEERDKHINKIREIKRLGW